MTLFNGMLKPWSRALILMACVLVFGRCGSSDDGDGPLSFSAVFADSETTTLTAKGYANDPRIVLTGKTGTAYTIRVDDGGSWCWTSRRTHATTRTGTLAAKRDFIYLYLDANDAANAADRRATLTVAFDGGETFSLTIDQTAYSIPGDFDREWAELPAYVENSDYMYVTHYAPLTTTLTARNYTICYDKTKRIANWVAYPLHSIYMQGYVRSNAWGYDPEVPTEYQADLTRGSYRGGGIRGHQCMSNHRYVPYDNLLNEQTFYSTNIMPQDYDFNGGSWLSMETVASAQKCNDTLYVVTGTYGVRSWSSDKSGTKVAMPEYCWKVLLRTRTGKTGKRIDEITDASELKAVAFWAANSSESKDGLKEYITSVADVERKTGYKFFTMLDEAIADEVKAQNKPSDWGIN